MNSKINLILFLSLILVSSCGTKENEDEKIDVKTEVNADSNFNSEEFDFVLPQPISLAKAFQSSGLSYNPSATNPASNYKNYTSKVKQLLNLGVYSTDLAYCAINEKPQEAREFLNSVKELGNLVGLKPVFSDKKLIEKFDKNLKDMEAIESLIYDIQERSEEFLDDNDIRYLAVVQFSGSWTEGMYLGVQEIENKKGTKNLSISLVDQIGLLKNIIRGIKTYPTSDETLTAVVKKLNDILSTYDNFESVKKANENTTFVTPILSENELNTLSIKIKDLRNYIVK